jgi:hypothetical protein
MTVHIYKRRALRPTNEIAVYQVEYVDRDRKPIQAIEITKNDCL